MVFSTEHKILNVKSKLSIAVFLRKISWLGDNVAHCFSFFLTVLIKQSALFILMEKIISTFVLIVPSLVFLFQGERSTLGAMSLGSLSQSGSLSPRRNSRSSLGGSRSSLHRSNESLPTASRSATADAIFMEEFGKGQKEAAAAREGK